MKQERDSVLNRNCYNQFRHEYPYLDPSRTNQLFWSQKAFQCWMMTPPKALSILILRKHCLLLDQWNNLVHILVSFKCCTLVLLVLLPLNVIKNKLKSVTLFLVKTFSEFLMETFCLINVVLYSIVIKALLSCETARNTKWNQEGVWACYCFSHFGRSLLQKGGKEFSWWIRSSRSFQTSGRIKTGR